MKRGQTPLEKLRHHVTGAIERGEAVAIEAVVTPKHTPGPWKFLDDRAVVAGDVLIAQTSKINDSNYANANLIAAAPEMLEALNLIRDALVAKSSVNEDFSDELAVIDQAIAKARGES